MKEFNFNVLLENGKETFVYASGKDKIDARKNARQNHKIKQFLGWFQFIGFVSILLVSPLNGQNWIEPIAPLVINDTIPDEIPSYYEVDDVTYCTYETFTIHPDTAQVKLAETKRLFEEALSNNSPFKHECEVIFKYYKYINSCYLQFIDVTYYLNNDKYIVRYYKRPSGSELRKFLQ